MGLSCSVSSDTYTVGGFAANQGEPSPLRTTAKVSSLRKLRSATSYFWHTLYKSFNAFILEVAAWNLMNGMMILLRIQSVNLS